MAKTQSYKFATILDSVGIGLSGLCLVHCLALPIVIATFPLLGTKIMSHETFHQVILIGVLPAAILSLGLGYLRHRYKRILILGTLGVAALVFAAFSLHAAHAHSQETAVTVVGGILLALAHWDNHRCRHKQKRGVCNV